MSWMYRFVSMFPVALFVCSSFGCSSQTSTPVEPDQESLNQESANRLAGSPSDSNQASQNLAAAHPQSSGGQSLQPIGGPGSNFGMPDSDRPVSQTAVPGTPGFKPPNVGASGPNSLDGQSSHAAPGQSDPASGLIPQALSPEGRQLRSNLTPPELIRFLGDIDQEMRALITGQSRIKDPGAIQAEVERVVQLKQTASQRLMDHPDASDAARVTGQRGFLQAMSHRASMGDVRAAEELQTFAEKHRDDENGDLRSDSRLVLIGFAIESLRNGKEDAAKRVLSLMKDVASNPQQVDVAMLMVMAQAKDALLQYEHVDEAGEIRQLILDHFGASNDPEVARMAAMIAASGFAAEDQDIQRLDQLRTDIVDPQPGTSNVTVDQWESAVNAVLEKTIDLLTIQFLAGVSLETEAVGRLDIAEATYQIMSDRIAQRQDSVGREARTALQAKANREAVIGQVFSPELPSVDGSPLNMRDYRGKVVLMPFWSSVFPDSLATLPNLEAIQARFPDDVAIVGMNLDLEGTDVQGFMKQNSLRFPSYRSVSDSQAAVANEVAYRFGAVSLLFVAVIDQDGKVIEVDFSGRDLSEMVENQIR
ncbi:Thiol-disulfide isomerase or thioredoxin [Neorhodopirellula lusitana]|uniref:Thiol-disulfide isomerase or thioredoxin n=1 Tax=Neorhodopirellula lusitana TaxID=445327 RepID=A0ABY1PRR3_9BACT|nr:redoxin family protein [Neorhodopirellula lusitana]SMP39093.1 Thiol-disulfide isomerase or thioredoxin [Neorhodopirellula lusitana]